MIEALKIQNLQFLYSLCDFIDRLIRIYIGKNLLEDIKHIFKFKILE
jgi:hypothetical protein